jgi:Tfp pilus assembly protein PilF
MMALAQAGCLVLDTARLKSGGGDRPAPEAGMLPAAESARACQEVAAALAKQGHHDQAVGQLLKAREFDHACDVSPALARLYARLGDDRAARAEFDLALKAHPKDADLLNDLGYFHYQRGNWAEAETCLRAAVVASPTLARAWVNLGLTLGQQKRYPDSLEAFERAVKPAEARCNLAFVLLSQGSRDRARELYNDALRLDPGLALARQALARLDATEKPKAD